VVVVVAVVIVVVVVVVVGTNRDESPWRRIKRR